MCECGVFVCVCLGVPGHAYAYVCACVHACLLACVLKQVTCVN